MHDTNAKESEVEVEVEVEEKERMENQEGLVQWWIDQCRNPAYVPCRILDFSFLCVTQE